MIGGGKRHKHCALRETFFARAVAGGAVPIFYCRTDFTRRIQQLLQAILRVAGIERAPAFLVQSTIQPRQHQRAIGQPCDGGEQLSAVAGMEPVEPAAITMPPGGRVFSRSASDSANGCAVRPD